MTGTDFEPAFLDMQADTESHYGRMARSRQLCKRPTNWAEVRLSIVSSSSVVLWCHA